MRMRGNTEKGRYILVRFTDEEKKRINKFLKRRGCTFQTFAHAAIIRAMNEADLGKLTNDEPTKEKKPTIKGLGIRERLDEDREHDEEQAAEDREHQRVLERERARDRERVHITSTPVLASVSANDEVMTLARTIVNASPSAREEVKKAACRALTKGRTLEEAVRLTEQLNEAIGQLKDVPTSALERVRARREGR